MDRQIVYPGGIPLDTDLLGAQRNALVAIGYLAQATLGKGVVVDGLTCGPTAPASLSVVVQPGSITNFGSVDVADFGSLPAEPVEPLLRMGVTLTPTTFALLAPATPGQAINYLIEASMLESDATPVVLPYYNAANPSQPFSGPDNDGAAQNTQRLQSVQLQVKAGAPANSGSQSTPPVDSGWAGLYVVTVANGQTAITSSSIVLLPGAPFVTHKLPDLSPGTINLAVFTPTTQGNWAAPSGTTRVRLRLWGGGGSGGNGTGGAGGGGASGGYSEGFYGVAPGQSIAIAVGSGGVGAGTSGGNSSAGSLSSASGGPAGQNGGTGSGGAGGAAASVGSGTGGLLLPGTAGGDGFGASGGPWIGGQGAAAHESAAAAFVIGASGSAQAGRNGSAPGSGGGGGIGTGLGGQGGAGLVLIEW